MSRISIALVAAACLAFPVALGVYALSLGPWAEPAEVSSGLDQRFIDQAFQAEEPPLVLTPPALLDSQAGHSEGAALGTLARNDPQGAVELVRQALLNNPFILEEAIEALESARSLQEGEQLAEVIEANAPTLFDSVNASIMGNPEGPITLVEFLDYNCGFCKSAHADVMRLIDQNDDLRVVVKDFPVLGPGSLEAAQVAIALRAIGGDMVAFIDTMMREQDRRADAVLARDVALSLGADGTALDLALDSPALMDAIGEAYGLAEKLNIAGTPAFIVGRERLMGAVGFDRLAAAIQAERERLAAL